MQDLLFYSPFGEQLPVEQGGTLFGPQPWLLPLAPSVVLSFAGYGPLPRLDQSSRSSKELGNNTIYA
jgi:hypothetical protein